MNKHIEEDFSKMVANLLQSEFCKDFEPALLHGFMGIASEAGELLEKYLESIQYPGAIFTRTDTLIELSDLLHFMQMILGRLSLSITEVTQISVCHPSTYFYDKILLDQCTHFNSTLLRGFAGISSKSGELLNRYKKFMFYHGESYTRSEILEGLSKLFHYMQMIIDEYDSSIEEVMCINMAKLRTRYPEGYTHAKAITGNRDKEAEKANVEAAIDLFTTMRERKASGLGMDIDRDD